MIIKELKELGDDTSMDISIFVRFREMVIVESILSCFDSHKKSKGWDDNTPISEVIKEYLERHDFIETDYVYDCIENVTIDTIDE